jgi:Fe2+ transport system protein FeoA
MLKSTLADLALQASAVVESLEMDFALRERLFALGLRVGRTIHVVRRCGRHGPLQVRVDHTDVILRGTEARRIRVVPVGGEARA